MESRWSGTSTPHHSNRNLSRQENRYKRSGNQNKVNGNVDQENNGNRSHGSNVSNDQYRSAKSPHQKRSNFKQDNNRFDKKAPSFGAKNNSKFSKPGFSNKGKTRKPNEAEKRVKITSDLQITDGKYLGQAIQSSLSPKKAVTPRTARDTMYKSIARRVKAGRFLDIGAGSGSVGIEALSRGAMLVDFVERSPKMTSLIRKNLNSFEIKESHGQIHLAEADAFLKKADINRRIWEIIYLYYQNEDDCEFALERLSDGVGTEKGGLVILEHEKDWKSPDKVGCLHRWRVFDKCEKALSFYTHK